MNVHDMLSAIATNIERVIHGQHRTIRQLLAAFVSGGHVLIEDFPGTGKTTLAKALARSIDADFQRVQFTPDLLPTDILGAAIYDPREQAFRLHRGPIFTAILLADEINRASPRTQSALLEAMAEAQVSLEGETHRLDDLFFVIATQNPVEFHGTYPLPEAQLDRFAMRLHLGYVSPEEEVSILTAHQGRDPLEALEPVAQRDDLCTVRRAAAAVRVSDEIKRYVVDLVTATRSCKGVQMGASPRASLTLLKSAQALVLFDGVDFLTPDHVQELAQPVLAHRLLLDSDAHFSGLTPVRVIEDIIRQVPVPR
ncbi:MAG: AAA family ATPase [Chromatiales bacterium]